MKRATIAGTFPTPKIGIINANSAKEGTVCSALVMPITTVASLGKRVKITPIGTATRIPKSKAAKEIYKCSRLLVTNWPPYSLKKLCMR